MPTRKDPTSRWLCVDPGETTGWSIWKGKRLIGGGQTPLWQFALDVQLTLQQHRLEPCEGSALAADLNAHRNDRSDDAPLGTGEQPWLHPGVDPAENTGPITLFVVEKFVLYPWEAKNLSWDEFRTSQLIGALTLLSINHGVELHKQGATIKDQALKGGAAELFISPVHENRHQNDSIMHGWFFVRVELLGAKVGLKDGTAQMQAAHHPV